MLSIFCLLGIILQLLELSAISLSSVQRAGVGRGTPSPLISFQLHLECVKDTREEREILSILIDKLTVKTVQEILFCSFI